MGFASLTSPLSSADVTILLLLSSIWPCIMVKSLFSNSSQGRGIFKKLYDSNSTHITAISRSLKTSNSEGAVVKAKVGHFQLMEIYIGLDVFQ